MLYTQRQYSAALDELEQVTALMPDHYTALHFRGMCNAQLYECEDAIADLTGRAHNCDALCSRGLCHLTLGNHEKLLMSFSEVTHLTAGLETVSLSQQRLQQQ